MIIFQGIILWWILISAQLSLNEKYTTLDLAKPLSYSVLFSEGDSVISTSNVKAPAKGMHDYNTFISINKKSGLLLVSHESQTISHALGDGGGASIVSLRKENGKWKSYGTPTAVNFSNVGGTMKNCSGELTGSKKVFSAEEFPPASNTELYFNESGNKGFSDTSDFKGLKRWQNMGWIVEIDPFTRQATRKLYNMGRFSHEDVLVMPDQKTVFLTDDFSPSVFFKFIAKTPGEFEEGQLFAYKEDNPAGEKWLKLHMHMDSLLIIREVSIRMGATLFERMEWMQLVQNKIYICETGNDMFDWSHPVKSGAIPSSHIAGKIYDQNANIYDYPYGALLELDLKSDRIKPILLGGPGLNSQNHFSNPDALGVYKNGKKQYLIICEDIIHPSKGRSPVPEKIVNEIYALDLDITSPTADDLVKIATCPYGSEPTGIAFSPDYEVMFLNIQHPDADNTPPFNRSVTIAITGLEKILK